MIDLKTKFRLLGIHFIFLFNKNMIGKLKGFVDGIFDDSVLFDVNGVCYIVFVDRKTLFFLGSLSTKIDLFIETVVRETGTTLFGFLTFQDQVWFRQLVKLNGISGKIAMAIMGNLDNNSLSIAIATKDEKLISTVPGIGKKLANRIVNELDGVNEKIANEILIYQPLKININTQSANIAVSQNITTAEPEIQVPYNLMQDAITAICSLGFSRQIVYNIVQKIIKNNPKIELELLVKEGIKNLGEK